MIWIIPLKEHTIFGIEMCMTSNFKPQEWSIYNQVTEAEAT